MRLSRRGLLWGVAALSASAAALAVARQPISRLSVKWPGLEARVRRIGYLSSNPSGRGELDPFLQGLSELGYAEGRDYALQTRYAELHYEKAPALAAELVATEPDVVLTEAYPATQAAKDATAEAAGIGKPPIPVVFVLVTDPIGLGLVASLAKPGGNITGLSTLSPALSNKRMELLKAVAPDVKRVGVLHDPSNPSTLAIFNQTASAGEALGLDVSSIPVRLLDDADGARAAALAARVGALMPLPATVFQVAELHKRLVEFAAQNRMVIVSTDRGSPPASADGVLLAVGPGYTRIFRRAADYVDKIFKGAQPADLPVEQPTTFDVMVNLKVAQALGLSIPPEVAEQVTEWIR
ncbi:MAG: ABC transporter substrate-binding protein [Chloroflexi bacterium]|nr:ABC transporter substrate-binding protein [Chloroflexota bacterium]